MSYFHSLRLALLVFLNQDTRFIGVIVCILWQKVSQWARPLSKHEKKNCIAFQKEQDECIGNRHTVMYRIVGSAKFFQLAQIQKQSSVVRDATLKPSWDPAGVEPGNQEGPGC